MWRWIFMVIPLAMLAVVGLALAEAITLGASWMVLVALAFGAVGVLTLAVFMAFMIGVGIGTAV